MGIIPEMGREKGVIRRRRNDGDLDDNDDIHSNNYDSTECGKHVI